MIHPHTEIRFINEVIGHGVVATRPIPRGTITWVRDALDQVFTPEQVERMAPPYLPILDKYTFVDGNGDFVLCWDLARFINHSCDPSCLAPGWDFEVAVRDIAPGEELTDDYGSLNVSASFVCHCGGSHCRREVKPNDFAALAARWDATVRGMFPLVGTVEQPLWDLLREKDAVAAALAGRAEVPSCRVHRAGAERVRRAEEALRAPASGDPRQQQVGRRRRPG
jgi:hypothetical protein